MVLRFDDQIIGPAGRAELTAIQPNQSVGAVQQGGVAVNLNLGSDLQAGSTVVDTTAVEFGSARFGRAGPTLNVVGGGGFNTALEQNLQALNMGGFDLGNVNFGRRIVDR